MELVRAVNNDIEPIQISSEDMTKLSIDKYVTISIKDAIKAHKLVPSFELLVQAKEKELGIKRHLWNPIQLEELENYFVKRYLT
ncbi:hypothetical protein [Romboutsia sp.]|uniref:hypothetical protein n=1 Tax=Romboutsia sp. TaxID=1965302 RepID=UPI002CCA48CF|nr:hypothetical protein [Romboutsia sp.]HSQ90315.1 hypothetical protein [Romboutsia sp.]